MSEQVYEGKDMVEADTPLTRLIEVGGATIKLLSRIDARHMDLPEDQPPTPSEALRALHAEQDQYPSDELAA